jgi:hypothetical protein
MPGCRGLWNDYTCPRQCAQFLSSGFPRSSYITGEVLPIIGGYGGG